MNARRCEPILLFGDFNSEIDSEQMRAITQSPLALRDARAVSKSAPFGPRGTFNGFKASPTEAVAIDHVLLGNRIDVARYAVFSQVIEGRVPGSHARGLARHGGQRAQDQRPRALLSRAL